MFASYPREFRDGVVVVACRCESGVMLKQIAEDFGIAEASLANWLKQADIEDGKCSGLMGAEQVESRQLRKRLRFLEQENEVLGRVAVYLLRASLKLGGSLK